MTFPECEVDGCTTERRSRYARWCHMHYWRVRRTGTVEATDYTLAPQGISYRGMHWRIRQARGPATLYRCVDCFGTAQDWSYDYSGLDEEISPDGKLFSRDVYCYRPRCKSCHEIHDKAIELERAS